LKHGDAERRRYGALLRARLTREESVQDWPGRGAAREGEGE